VTSRTQWLRFSIDQWPRTSSSSWAGEACCGLRLVMIVASSWRTLPVRTSVVIRSIRPAWPQWGKSR